MTFKKQVMSCVIARWDYSAGLNSSFPTPQSGHSKSSGRSSNAVPGSMPISGTPTSGSYSHPHVSQTYFPIIVVCVLKS